MSDSRPPGRLALSLGRLVGPAMALMLVLLGACGRVTPAPVTATAPATASTIAAPTAVLPRASSTVPPTPLPSPTPGPVTISLGLAQLPGTLDPANAVDESALIIVRHLYEGLTAFSPGTTQVIPALAERWETTADGLTWTFHLRSGVRFSDGTPFSAEAAQQNFERWLSAAPPGGYAFWRALFGGFAGELGPDGEPLALVAGVAARDDDTLVIELHRPDASLPNSLALPSFAMVSPAALANGGSLDRISAGTGPFVLEAWPQPDLVRLSRNQDYWNELAASQDGPDELVVKVIPDDTQRLLALQTGEIEGMARVNPRDYAAVSAPNSGLRLEFDPALNVVYLGINQARPPWSSLDCRLAVAHALDKARYVRDHFPGDGQVARAMQPPAVWGNRDVAEDRPFDRALAQQHWQACQTANTGWSGNFTLYVPPIPRTYLPDPAGLGAAIQADLAAAGITVTVTAPEWGTWLADVHSGRADLFVLGWVGLNGDPDGFLCPLFCGLEGGLNSDNRGHPVPPDPELAALLLQARTVSDPGARAELYARAHARLFETVPAIPLAHRQTAWAYQAGLLGTLPSPIESLFFNLHHAP